MVALPAGYDDLLERPLYGHLATARPDGALQVSPMWFDWDGELLRFAHTTKRQKYRKCTKQPAGCDVDLGYRQSLPLPGSARRRRAHRARSGGELLPASGQALQRGRTSSRRPAPGRGSRRRRGLNGYRGAPDRIQQALVRRIVVRRAAFRQYRSGTKCHG